MKKDEKFSVLGLPFLKKKKKKKNKRGEGKYRSHNTPLYY